MDHDNSFGAWLKRRRRFLDLTQRALALRTSCSVGTIRKIEANERRPSKQLAALLAKSLDIRAEQKEPFISFSRADPYTDSTLPFLSGMDDALFRERSLPQTEITALPRKELKVPHNLPPQSTPFIGREKELAELDAFISDRQIRLITIVGPGGMGKTRLALALAKKQLSGADGVTDALFPDGVFFIKLAALSDPEHIIPLLAETLDLSLQAGVDEWHSHRQQLLDYLKRKRLLLFMDNFDHLLEAVDLLVNIMQNAPEVTIVATSRERLHSRLEQVYLLRGLFFPDGSEETMIVDYPASRLFLQAARRNKAGFDLRGVNDQNELAHICRLVEGMPLAIELAAAWVDMLSLAEIAEELQRDLELLKTTLCDVPVRHRSMRASFDTSWQRLDEQEQALFAQLSVFRGGFTRQAGMEVSGASLNLVARLVNKSLLQVNETDGRYQVHELLRQYGEEKLAERSTVEEAVLDRHSAYYCQVLADRAGDLKGSRQMEALAEITADIDNVRSAWQRAADRVEAARLKQALEGIRLFYEFHSRLEEGEWACRLAADKLSAAVFGPASGDGDADLLTALISCLTRQASFRFNLGNPNHSRQLLNRCLALLDDRRLAGQDTRAERAAILSVSAENFGENYGEQEKLWAKEGLDLYRQLGDKYGTAKALYYLGRHQDSAAAKASFEESLVICEELGNQTGIAAALWQLAAIAGHQGRLQESDGLARQAMAIYREAGEPRGLSLGLRGLASICVWRGRFCEARALVEEYLVLLEDLGFSSTFSFAHALAGYPALYLGLYREAEAQAKKGLALCRKTGTDSGIGLAISIMARAALAEGRLGEALLRFREALSIYRLIDARNNLAQGLAVLSCVARTKAQFAEARGYLMEALQLANEQHSFLPLIHALPGLALVLADEGYPEKAVELYALAMTQGIVANSKWFEDIAGRELAEVAASLPPEVAQAARARGQALDLWQTAADLVEELTALGWDNSGE